MDRYSDIPTRRHRRHSQDQAITREEDRYEIQPYPRHRHHEHHGYHRRRSRSSHRDYLCGGVFHAFAFEVYELWDAALYGLGALLHKMRI